MAPAAGKAELRKWRYSLPLASGLVAAFVVARWVDSAPVVVGGQPLVWLPLMFLLLLLVLPFLAAGAGTRWERLTDWLIAILFALPFWTMACGFTLEWWNRRHDSSVGEWLQASVVTTSHTRRGSFAKGRLERGIEGTTSDVSFRTAPTLRPGTTVWIRVHPGALGSPWGSEWSLTPPG